MSDKEDKFPSNEKVKKFKDLERKRSQSLEGGGKKRREDQHAKGKLTARERIDLLVDEDSFNEIDEFVTHQSDKFDMQEKKPLGDGIVTGHATIEGRPVYLYSQDFTVFGGSLGRAQATKICKVMDLATQSGTPIIGILDSGGARIQEGVASLAGYGDIFFRNTQASGVIPQISIVLGPCAGGAVYSPALTDFILMNRSNSFMFVTGPEVVKAVTMEEVSFFDLGGSEVHSEKTGTCHLVGETEDETLELARKLLSYLPSNNLDDPPRYPEKIKTNDQLVLREIIPQKDNEPYDMKTMILTLVDSDSFLELQENWARNIIIGFSKIDGITTGIIANQPFYLGGAIDSNAADKASRFIRFCDSFNLPLLTLVDVPGFLPGVKQEHNGLIRHGAKLLFAYSEATVPKITVIIRKAFGGAYIVMGSKHLGSDLNLAWSTAAIAVMGSESASRVLYKNKLKDSENPEVILEEFATKFKTEFANPYQAAELGYIDKVIFPEETRNLVIQSLKILRNKRVNSPKRKHGVPPV